MTGNETHRPRVPPPGRRPGSIGKVGAARLAACRRILLVGCSGAGKSTLARDLGRRLGLPVIHLDQHYWNPGWVPTPDDEWDRKLAALLQRPEWVMDGGYHRTFPERLAVADAVLFLDLPPALCRWRIVRRIAGSFGRVRPDLAPGCPEQIDREFLRWVWAWPRDVRPQLLKALEETPAGVLRKDLRSSAEVRELLDSLGPT
jgi:adenylate kinase family enzyme